MANRDPDLASLLHELKAAWIAAAPAGSPAALALAEAARRVRDPGPPSGIAPERAPVNDWFKPAVANAANTPTAGLADALLKLAPRLAWRRRIDRKSENPNFANAHANAVILGDGGIESREDVRIGISLLAPSTVYPDHRHPPEEVYVVLSEGEWRQGASPWHAPGPGGMVHNPPNVLHGMQSGAQPLLAVWTLLMDGPSPRPSPP